MIGELIYKAKGQKVVDVLAWDHIGYDRGFTLELEDGTKLDVYPIDTQMDARLVIKEVE